MLLEDRPGIDVRTANEQGGLEGEIPGGEGKRIENAAIPEFREKSY